MHDLNSCPIESYRVPKLWYQVLMPQIPGVSLTTRQPSKTCGYQVPRYHTHMSHISRPIPAYLIHNIQKPMIDYNHNLFIVPLIQKGVHVLVMLKYNTRQKQNKTSHVRLSSHMRFHMRVSRLYQTCTLKGDPTTG